MSGTGCEDPTPAIHDAAEYVVICTRQLLALVSVG